MSHLAGLVYTGVPATGVLSWPSVADVTRVVRCQVSSLPAHDKVPMLIDGCCVLLVPLDRLALLGPSDRDEATAFGSALPEQLGIGPELTPCPVGQLARHNRILASCYNPDKDPDGGAHRLTELLTTAFGN